MKPMNRRRFRSATYPVRSPQRPFENWLFAAFGRFEAAPEALPRAFSRHTRNNSGYDGGRHSGMTEPDRTRHGRYSQTVSQPLSFSRGG